MAWDSVVAAVSAKGIDLIDFDRWGLHMMVTMYVEYRALFDAARSQPENASELLLRAEEWRVEMREWATNYLLIPEMRTKLALMREDGFDLELARIFEPS